MRTILRLIFKSKSFSQSLKVFLILLGIAATHARGQVSGYVFIDYDSNGQRTNSKPVEIGVPGVKVQLFVGSNTTPLTAVTGTDGVYAFTSLQAPKDSLVRIEFSNFPETFSPSLVGANSNTAIQFVKAPAENANLGIVNDDEYCHSGAGPKVATACYVMGDPLAGGSAGEDPALVLFDYNAQGLAGVDDHSMVKLAKAKDIGPTWIASYQRDSKRLMVGAIVRRHVGMGPLGTGGMYYIDLGDNSIHSFVDVKTLGIDTGPDPHIDPVTQLNVLPASKTGRSRDSLAFHAAGKVGMGGVQFSRYQDTLFMVNLYDRKLYSFKVGKPLHVPATLAEANVKSYTIPSPNCANGDFVPWALKYYRNRLYIGVVCTAETSQKKSDLKAAVYEFNFKDHIFKNVLEFPLGYTRDPLDGTQGCDTINTWKPWSGIFPKQCNYPMGAPDPISAFLVNPQPILSDIEFDDDGSMFIGMLDRGGLQTGQNQPGIAIDDTLNYYGFMSGDLLRAQRNSDGSFTMESNGKSGIYTANGGSGPGVPNAHDKGAGPGGGEFFYDDYWINGQGGIGHAELTNGGIFKEPGNPEIFSSAFDPLHQIYLATGFIVFDTQTGQRKRSYAVYSIQEGALGKSGGVGDLTSACDPAPLEIGNRVWFDSNRNGIQDPNEVGVDNVVLTLHDMEAGGTEAGRDTTANGGQYYFNDSNVAGGILKRNHKYEIRMSTLQTLSGNLKGFAGQKNAKQAGLLPTTFVIKDSLEVTLRDTSGVNDARNSDAVYNSDSTQVVISLKTGENSQNNHNLDIGWMQILPPASVGDYAWYDLNRNGIQDLRKDPFGTVLGPELPVKGVIMQLYDNTDQFVKSDTTGVDGIYGIDEVPTGQYYIKFNPASYPAPDFVLSDMNKGTNDSLDNDVERVVYKTATFTLAPGQHDPRWDIGFFRSSTPEISDPCACDTTVLYFPGNDDYSKYVYREKVTIKATPGGKWALIPYDVKKNVTTYGLYEDDGEGYILPIDLNKKHYFFTEVPDSLGLYEFKFAHKSVDGYALAATDGVDTLSIGAICYEVKEQYDTRLDSALCFNAPKIQLQRNFPNGTATYYLIDTTAFVFRDGFNEFTLLEAAVKRGPITELDPKNYRPNSTISLYVKWEPFGASNHKGACQKSMILNVNISNTGACTPPNDLELTKTVVGDCRRQVGDQVQFKLVITNKTPDLTAIADSVFVEDMMSDNFTFVNYVATHGQYNALTGMWGPLKLAAGQSDTLTLTVTINNEGGFIGGSICNEAEVVAMSKKSGPDIDSSPGNGIKSEDDYDIACVSVPLKICPERRDTLIISAPAGYASYQWFKNGVKIDGATAQTLEVGDIGEYSVQVSDGVCPTANCCPVIVEYECICPPDICIPFTTKKIKKK
ncbi:MAG: SdrD B-like domain-containing protein [Spirosomataceae bacterium]